MNVILDTNIWVSRLLWGGPPGRILDLAGAKQIRVSISALQLEEIDRTLAKPKLQPKLNQLSTSSATIIKAIRAISQTVPAAPVTLETLRDPDDAIILAVAIAADADVIITGDRDLLILTEFSGIPILTPQTFLTRYFPSNE